jgi:hypothetical protein
MQTWILEGRESTDTGWFLVNRFVHRTDAMRDWHTVNRLHPSNEYRVRKVTIGR